MTIDELIEAAKKRSVTEETIEAFKDRIEDCKEEFDEEYRSQAVDDEFLARSYNL